MLHCDPGLFRSTLLLFQVALRRSSVLAFEESAVLPRWDLLPGSDGAAYQANSRSYCASLCSQLHFTVDRAVTYRLTG